MSLYYQSPWMTIDVAESAQAAADGSRTKTADIRIDGPVGQYDYGADTWKDAKRLLKDAIRKELDALAALKVQEIKVEISSLGGSFQHALAIHDYLAQYPGKVTTRVIGMTASAATIIAQAASHREMSANALYLIHRSGNCVAGNAIALRKLADTFETFDSRMAAIYAKRSGKPEAEILAVMDEDEGVGRWMTADRAKSLGLVDAIFEPMDAAACAAPATDALASAGLPQIPSGTYVPPVPKQQPEQTAQTDVCGSNRMEDRHQNHGAQTSMKISADQLKTLQERFGPETALAAVTEDLDFATALDRGATAQAKALTDARAQITTVTTERDAAVAEAADLKKKLADAEAGMKDPLASSGTAAQAAAAAAAAAANPDAAAKAKAEAEEKEDKAKMDALVSAASAN